MATFVEETQVILNEITNIRTGPLLSGRCVCVCVRVFVYERASARVSMHDYVHNGPVYFQQTLKVFPGNCRRESALICQEVRLKRPEPKVGPKAKRKVASASDGRVNQ